MKKFIIAQKLFVIISLSLFTLDTYGMIRSLIFKQSIHRPSKNMQGKYYSTHVKESYSDSSSAIRISENCYRKWRQVSRDAACLSYYMKETLRQTARIADYEYRPSHFLKYLRDKSDMDLAIEPEYMPASHYFHLFINDEKYHKMDQLFVEKLNQTKNVEESWNWFNDYFSQEMQQSIDIYCKNMIERNAILITLSEHGMNEIKEKTIVIAGNSLAEIEDQHIIKILSKFYCEKE